VDSSDKPLNSGRRGPNLPIHAAAGVEHDAHTDRQLVRLTEMRDLLGLTVFFDYQVVFGQIRHIVTRLVRDGGDHVHQGDIDFQLCGDDRRCQKGSDQKDQTRTTHSVFTSKAWGIRGNSGSYVQIT